MSESVLAWHFVGDTLRDGSPVPTDGEWLSHDGPIEMCAKGLHASIHPIDALQYAPGTVLCRVECRGDIEHQHDKLVCRQRRIIGRHDMTGEMRAFAREQALSVVHLWNPPPVVLEYLNTGDENLRAGAQAAAWDAAWAAARAGARDAAQYATWAAAQYATWAGARAGAWAGARDAWKDRVHRVFGITAA